MSYSSNDVASRIRARLDDLELTPRAASLAAGGSPDLIRNLFRTAEKGRDFTPRADTLERLAPVLKTSVEWLLTGAGKAGMLDTPLVTQAPGSFASLPVIATVEAGVWREGAPAAPRDVMIPPDTRFASVPQIAFVLRGQFAEQYPFRDGMYLISAEYGDYSRQRGDLRAGDFVILERERGSRERELSLREVSISGNTVSLASVSLGHGTATLPRGQRGERGSRILAVLLTALVMF